MGSRDMCGCVWVSRHVGENSNKQQVVVAQGLVGDHRDAPGSGGMTLL